jgi:chromosomal replication initiation ATPase DnaA
MLAMKQLAFELFPELNSEQLKFSADSLIVHSGIVDAYQGISEMLTLWKDDPSKPCCIVVVGPAGSGKSHLQHALLESFGLEENELVESFDLRELTWSESDRIYSETPNFINRYEHLRAKNGLFLVEMQLRPENLLDPHLRSRLASARVLNLQNPEFAEIAPILRAIAERRHLRLSPQSVEYLCRQLPSNPMAICKIIESIDNFSLMERRNLKASFVKDVVKNEL